MDKIVEIKRIAAELQALYPDTHPVLTVHELGIEFCSHSTKTYNQATEFFRDLGIQQRNKRGLFDLYGD